MFASLALVLIAICAFVLYLNTSSLLKNIAIAKRTGLPYVITPINLYNPLWMASSQYLLPLLARLPKSWTESWIEYTDRDWPWKSLQSPWAKNGEIFLTVSPGLNHAWVANAEAIRQITERRTSFPKPVETYKILDIFGRNVVTTEGIEWKTHRKITSPSFNEKNNSLVFAEACSQAQEMLKRWSNAEQKGRKVDSVATDTMRFALYVISSVGFGVRLLWPGARTDGENSPHGIYSSDRAPEGFSMSFEKSLTVLTGRIVWILLAPEWLLKHLPSKSAHEALEAYRNWSRYMQDLLNRKIDQVRSGENVEGMDLMGSLVGSAYGQEPNPTEKHGQSITSKGVLSESHILGNAFVMIIAGHETTANSLFISLIELAIKPESQRQAQLEIQEIYGDKAPENWIYDSTINKLLGGMLGAILSEQLRLMPPSITIPKTVLQDQDIMVDGKRVTFFAGTQLNLIAFGAHRNPRYWPTKPSTVSHRRDDLDDFKPERWLVKHGAGDKLQPEGVIEPSKDHGSGVVNTKTKSSNIFRPTPGSYFPFSEGARSCLGRRLAQVEIMAALAIIFQQHSIELAVDEWASDDEVAAMSIDEKISLYEKAKEKARQTMRTARTVITLKLQSGSIPIRVVKKGEERFIKHMQ